MSLISILERLTKHDVAYCLVGGFAANSHGSSMVTRDVDVACSMDPENLTRLYFALEGLHPLHRMAKPPRPFTEEDAGKTHWRNVYLHTDLGQLDCLGELKGIGDFEAVMQRSIVQDLKDFQLRVISLDALIEAKEAMGRPRDLENAKILRAIRERQQESQ